MAYVKKTNNPRMGRPTKNPRTEDINIRLSKTEFDILAELAEKTGMTRTDIIVEGVKLFRKKLKAESEK